MIVECDCIYIYSIKKKQTRLKFGYVDITSIETIDTNKEREFDVCVRNGHRVDVKFKDDKKHVASHVNKQITYTFRFKTTQIRDQWITQLHESLDQSVKHVLSELYQE